METSFNYKITKLRNDLKDYIIEKDITQARLSELTGVSAGTISVFLRGANITTSFVEQLQRFIDGTKLEKKNETRLNNQTDIGFAFDCMKRGLKVKRKVWETKCIMLEKVKLNDDDYESSILIAISNGRKAPTQLNIIDMIATDWLVVN